MVTWAEFVDAAPSLSEHFLRRHSATGNLCLIATLRSDGYPRISPMEPRVVDGHLVMVGMEGTTKYRDLDRDPRFCLHTATEDPHLGEGDVKLWARAVDVQDQSLHEQFADELFEETGMDLRTEVFDPFYVADITGASSIVLDGNELVITIWRPGEGLRIVKKS